MSQQHGPWTIQKTEQKYQNPFLEVNEDEVLQPDGEPGTYGTVTLKSGVAILPLDDEGNVYLIRHFRYALGKESLEVVSGGWEEPEVVLEAAKRETQEELGIQAKDWMSLGVVDLDTSIVRCPVHLFLARGLSFQESQPEGTETMELCKVPLETAFHQVMDGTITHAASCVLILKTWCL